MTQPIDYSLPVDVRAIPRKVSTCVVVTEIFGKQGASYPTWRVYPSRISPIEALLGLVSSAHLANFHRLVLDSFEAAKYSLLCSYSAEICHHSKSSITVNLNSAQSTQGLVAFAIYATSLAGRHYESWARACATDCGISVVMQHNKLKG